VEAQQGHHQQLLQQQNQPQQVNKKQFSPVYPWSVIDVLKGVSGEIGMTQKS
jgi:hypothetical protein